jgi:predicted Zn finger-like uncharacterized protein
MILTCPQCATRYQTDTSLFAPPGRKVKCAKCGHVWLQAAPPLEPDVGAAAESQPQPVQEPALRAGEASESVPGDFRQYTPLRPSLETRSPWLPRLGLALGWLGLAAIILLVGWSADVYRQQIASLWPQSASLYSALGLKVNARGIDIRDVAYRIEKQDGQSVLAVSGALVNITRRELTVPPVNVVLTDDDKRTLYQWSFSSGAETLKPGQYVSFNTQLPNPPAGVRHLQVRLAGIGK